jgi:ADP-ribose pyrophosphatase YjhB (NUDIX family)
MIQEARAAKPLWKFPGGYVDRGETIKVAVEREVLEETGVKASFSGILAMREQLDYKYGAADFYIVCVLQPIDESLNILDTQEVSLAKWIPLAEIKPDN